MDVGQLGDLLLLLLGVYLRGRELAEKGREKDIHIS